MTDIQFNNELPSVLTQTSPFPHPTTASSSFHLIHFRKFASAARIVSDFEACRKHRQRYFFTPHPALAQYLTCLDPPLPEEASNSASLEQLPRWDDDNASFMTCIEKSPPSSGIIYTETELYQLSLAVEPGY
jgi:hypothetical protein